MKNWENQKEEILNITISGKQCAVDKSGNVVPCDGFNCSLCLFHGSSYCERSFAKWCQEEYEEPSKIQKEVKYCKVDTKVMVSDDGKEWHKRYLNKYDEKKDKALCFYSGCSSWTNSETYSPESVFEWSYARLPKEDEL